MKVIGSDLILNKKGKLEIKPRTPFLIIENAVKNESVVQSSTKYQHLRLNRQIEPNASSVRSNHSVMGE